MPGPARNSGFQAAHPTSPLPSRFDNLGRALYLNLPTYQPRQQQVAGSAELLIHLTKVIQLIVYGRNDFKEPPQYVVWRHEQWAAVREIAIQSWHCDIGY